MRGEGWDNIVMRALETEWQKGETLNKSAAYHWKSPVAEFIKDIRTRWLWWIPISGARRHGPWWWWWWKFYNFHNSYKVLKVLDSSMTMKIVTVMLCSNISSWIYFAAYPWKCRNLITQWSSIFSMASLHTQLQFPITVAVSPLQTSLKSHVFWGKFYPTVCHYNDLQHSHLC